jgi:hypothetical protein
MLGTMMGDSNMGATPSPTQNTQTEIMTQQTQNITVGFQVNSAELSQQDIQKIQNMKGYEGDITIIVHESQNSSGKDASYENQLVQKRGNAVMQALGRQANVQRGNNAQQPYVEIVFN